MTEVMVSEAFMLFEWIGSCELLDFNSLFFLQMLEFIGPLPSFKVTLFQKGQVGAKYSSSSLNVGFLSVCLVFLFVCLHVTPEIMESSWNNQRRSCRPAEDGRARKRESTCVLDNGNLSPIHLCPSCYIKQSIGNSLAVSNSLFCCLLQKVSW